MLIETTILKINKTLISAFALIDSWFDQPDTILKQRSASDSRSPVEVLEHVMLTNHFLLNLIENRKDRSIAILNGKDIAQEILNYLLDSDVIEKAAEEGSFLSDSFTDTRPSGARPPNEIRQTLREQLYRCMCQLELLQQDQRAVYQTTTSEIGTVKADASKYIYFLALHAKRHVAELEKYAQRQRESGRDSVCV